MQRKGKEIRTVGGREGKEIGQKKGDKRRNGNKEINQIIKERGRGN